MSACIHGSEDACPICPTLCEESWCRETKMPGLRWCEMHSEVPTPIIEPQGAKKEIPEKSLAENYAHFSTRLECFWDYHRLWVEKDGSLSIEARARGSESIQIRLSVEDVKTFLLPFVRGAYGRGVRPDEVEAFGKIVGGHHNRKEENPCSKTSP